MRTERHAAGTDLNGVLVMDSELEADQTHPRSAGAGAEFGADGGDRPDLSRAAFRDGDGEDVGQVDDDAGRRARDDQGFAGGLSAELPDLVLAEDRPEAARCGHVGLVEHGVAAAPGDGAGEFVAFAE